jgi:integrase/recombinase XerD
MSEERDEFIQWMNLKALSNKTQKDYLYYYDKWDGKSFTQKRVDNFITDLGFGTPVRAFIKNYQMFLKRQHPDNVDILKIDIPKRTGKSSRKIPDFLTLEEVERISKSIGNETYELMLLICFYGGLRSQGLMNIKVGDFEWDEWIENSDKNIKLKVNEKGNKERYVFIPSKVIRRIHKIITDKEEQTGREVPMDLKLWSMSYHTWRKKVNKHGSKVLGRRVHPHMIRHGCANWLRQNGYDITELKEYLGHADISTTQIYTHIDKEKLEAKYPIQ